MTDKSKQWREKVSNDPVVTLTVEEGSAVDFAVQAIAENPFIPDTWVRYMLDGYSDEVKELLKDETLKTLERVGIGHIDEERELRWKMSQNEEGTWQLVKPINNPKTAADVQPFWKKTDAFDESKALIGTLQECIKDKGYPYEISFAQKEVDALIDVPTQLIYIGNRLMQNVSAMTVMGGMSLIEEHNVFRSNAIKQMQGDPDKIMLHLESTGMSNRSVLDELEGLFQGSASDHAGIAMLGGTLHDSAKVIEALPKAIMQQLLAQGRGAEKRQ